MPIHRVGTDTSSVSTWCLTKCLETIHTDIWELCYHSNTHPIHWACLPAAPKGWCQGAELHSCSEGLPRRPHSAASLWRPFPHSFPTPALSNPSSTPSKPRPAHLHHNSELSDPVFTIVVTIQISTSCFLTNNIDRAVGAAVGAWVSWAPQHTGGQGAGAEDPIAAKLYVSSHTSKPLSRIQGLCKPTDTSSSRPAKAHPRGAGALHFAQTPQRSRPPRGEHVPGKEVTHHGR